MVSPANARKQLSSLIKGAKKELLIYDPKIGDPAMIRLLEDRAKADVDIRIIGEVTRHSDQLKVHKPPQRLHVRVVIRDHEQVFIGSQSLRTAELDSRREVGIIFRDRKTASKLIKTFREDWGTTEQSKQQGAQEEVTPAAKVAKKSASRR